MDQMKLVYQGTNAFVLTKQSSTLLIDPYYSRVGLGRLLTKIEPNLQRVAEGLRSAGIDGVDGILLTHTHFDHALDAAEVIRQQGGILFGSASAAKLAEGAGLNPEQYKIARPNEPQVVGSFQIVFHPSKHIAFPPPVKWLLPEKGRIENPLVTPAWFWDFRCGEVFAIQVDRLLFFGSAGYIPDAFHDLGIETVVLGIGGLEMKPFNYLKELYHEVVLASGARQILVSHWDHFFNPDLNNLKFLGLAKQTFHRVESLADRHGQTVHLLRAGEPYFV